MHKKTKDASGAVNNLEKLLSWICLVVWAFSLEGKEGEKNHIFSPVFLCFLNKKEFAAHLFSIYIW